MSELTNHEKFLTGVPLSPELAALKSGKLPDFDSFALDLPAEPVFDSEPAPGTGPLAKKERNALREMRLSPGWAIFQKLIHRAIMRHTNAAIKLSQVDPLRNSQDIAESWAYVNILKRVHHDLNLEMAAETKQEDEDGEA